MIGQALLSLPLAALLAYGLLEARRARLVGLSTAGLALATLALVWAPGVAGSIATAIGLGTASDLVAFSWIALSGLVILNVHLKLRRQMQVVTALARHVALTERQPLESADRAPVAFKIEPLDDDGPGLPAFDSIVELRPIAGRGQAAVAESGQPAAASDFEPADDDAVDEESIPTRPAAGGSRR